MRSRWPGGDDHLPATRAALPARRNTSSWSSGWSWRVSNMGLLNIGRKEGSAIIQLFGRGVRMRGKDFTLKRSSVLDGSHPEHVGLLETLNIFAVRANYMSQFREYLENEGVETEGDLELPLFIRPYKEFLGKGLVVPRLPEDRSFAGETDIFLEPDPLVRVRVDMSLKVETLESGREGVTAVAVRAGSERPIPTESLDLVEREAEKKHSLARAEVFLLRNLSTLGHKFGDVF